MKEDIERIIKKAIKDHLVSHVPTTDRRDRIDILVDEAATNIISFLKAGKFLVLDEKELEQLSMLFYPPCQLVYMSIKEIMETYQLNDSEKEELQKIVNPNKP